MSPFDDDRKLEITVGEARRVYATLCTGSFVPSMFAEVRDLMKTLDSKLGEVNEASNGTDSDGSES